MYIIKKYALNKHLYVLLQPKKFTSTTGNYCLLKSSFFMPPAGNIGCLKSCDEMFEHIWNFDSSSY